MAPPTTPRCSRSAFTLIELLVVIAIIALLMGILLPALGAARESARSLVCLTTQRSVGQSVMLYRNDNRDWGGRFNNHGVRRFANGLTPQEMADASQNTYFLRFGYWGLPYDDYVQSLDEAFACPSMQTMDPFPINPVQFPEIANQTAMGVNAFGRSEIVNTMQTGERLDERFRQALWTAIRKEGTVTTDDGELQATAIQLFMRPASQLSFPSAQIFAQDAFEHALEATPGAGDSWCGLSQYDSDELDGGIDGAFTDWKREYYRHNGVGNAVYIDGHAESKTVGEIGESGNASLWKLYSAYYGDMGPP